MSEENRSRVPDPLLERLALDELPEKRRAELRARLEAEPDGAQRLEALQRSNEEILERYPARAAAAQIEARLAAARPRRRPLLWALPATAAALLLLVSFSFWPRLAGELVSEEGVRLKSGGPQLLVYRQTARGAERLDDGATVRAGDQLQLAYRANGAKHGVIVSIDGRGSTTLHFPPSPAGSTALVDGPAQRLQSAFELDDAPRFERFFFVSGARPIAVETVRAAVSRGRADPVAPLALPPALTVRQLLLHKR